MYSNLPIIIEYRPQYNELKTRNYITLNECRTYIIPLYVMLLMYHRNYNNPRVYLMYTILFLRNDTTRHTHTRYCDA